MACPRAGDVSGLGPGRTPGPGAPEEGAFARTGETGSGEGFLLLGKRLDLAFSLDL